MNRLPHLQLMKISYYPNFANRKLREGEIKGKNTRELWALWVARLSTLLGLVHLLLIHMQSVSGKVFEYEVLCPNS